ncbi:TorF family putative porin [Colwellia sp. MEBiC06753]
MICFIPWQSYAEVSLTLTAASDYLFNGVSQTDDKPAIQGSIDWAGESGWYIGSWASNVDFGDDTDAEIDFYTGYSQELNDAWWYNVGLAYYTYVGGDNSSDINYTELSFTLGFHGTEFTTWYSDDYAGTEARHYIMALAHHFEISENHTLTLQIDRSSSLDKALFSWDDNDESYIHIKAMSAFSWRELAFTVSVEKTDLDYDDDVKLLGTVSYSFNL